EQSSKSAQLLPELKRCRNKNFYKYAVFPKGHANPKFPAVRMSTCKGRRFPICGAKNVRPLAESCDARFSFVCAICVRKNRAVSPDRSWSHIQTCSTRTFGGRCFLFPRLIRTTARLGCLSIGRSLESCPVWG